MKRNLLVMVLIAGCVGLLRGQSAQSFRQFYFNPYLFNPAYAGSAGYTEVYMSYRQQWAGIADSPETYSINVQRVTLGRVSLGASVNTQKAVGLRSTSLLGTFAYEVPLRDKESLRFGLTAGVGSNKLSFSEGEYNPNDPAVGRALTSNIYMDGNFGVLYSYDRLKIGFAFPRLIGQQSISPQKLGSKSLSQLQNRFYSISYLWQLRGEQLSVEPYFIYRENKDGQNYYEMGTTLTYQSLLWVGASYHKTSGMRFWAGFTVSERFRFSYSYELPPPGSGLGTNSSELQLNLRLEAQRVKGRKSEFNPVRPRNKNGKYKAKFR